MTSLFLPFPPSVNGMFKNRKGGRKKSDGYKMWLADAEEAYLKQRRHIKSHTGKVQVIIMLKAPDNRRRDCDNLIKSVCDFLVNQKIIVADDQRYVRSVMAMWKETMRESGCFVVVEDCENPDWGEA